MGRITYFNTGPQFDVYEPECLVTHVAVLAFRLFLPTALASQVMQSPPSVCPFVSTLSSEPTECLTLNFCMWVDHDHTSQGIECQGQANTVGLTSTEDSLFSIVCKETDFRDKRRALSCSGCSHSTLGLPGSDQTRHQAVWFNLVTRYTYTPVPDYWPAVFTSCEHR